jgi:outer membrane protein TolC
MLMMYSQVLIFLKRAGLLTGAAGGFLFCSQQAGALTMEEATIRYLERSPHLKAVREQYDLSSSDRWRRFIINEPQLQFANQDSNSSEVFGLSLPVAFPGKSIAYGKMDSAKQAVQRSEVTGKTYEAVRYAVQTYLDCAAARQQQSILTETVYDLQTLSNSLRAMYESGHSTQAERIGAELQLRQSQSDLQAAKDKEQVSCAKLLNVLSEDEGFLGTVTIPDDLPEAVLKNLESETADKARALAGVKLAMATADLSFWSQMPDLNLNFNRNHYLRLSASPSGDEWTTTYGISITLPILFPFHEYPEYRRSKTQALIDKNVAELQLQGAESDERDAAKEYQRSRVRLKEIENRDMALAQTLVESTFSAYKSGKLGFAELMTSRKTLADLKLQEMQLRISLINAHLRCVSRCEETEKQ